MNCDGETALHIAARTGDASICSLLLNSGASCTIKSQNGTPVDIANENCRSDILPMLQRALDRQRIVTRTRELVETIEESDEWGDVEVGEDKTIIKPKLAQGEFVHRFCLLHLIKPRKCVLCRSRISAYC